MPFDKVQAISELTDSRLELKTVHPLLHMQLEDGSGAEALTWCRSLAVCLTRVGIISNVYKDSIRFVDPVKGERVVCVRLDSKKGGGISDQVIITHGGGEKTPGEEKFLRTSWCTPFEAAVLTLISL